MAVSNLFPFRHIERDLLDTFTNTFVYEDYLWLVSGIKPDTTVIDIGAYVGDTTLYFAMQPNVKEVWAFEPYKSNFEKLKENVNKSPRKDKIKLFNIAIGKPGSNYKLKIKDIKTEAYAPLELGNGEEIEVLGLDTLLEKVSGNVALKINCDGCEFFALECCVDFSKVYRMQILVYNSFGPTSIEKQTMVMAGFKKQVVPSRIKDATWLYAWK